MDIIIDTIKDTYTMIPILFIMYLFLEYLEHRENNHYQKYLISYGPLLGSLLGMIPQCGFGVIASLLFLEKKITLGTLISVFIATSDEAIPVLLTFPQHYSSLIAILCIKMISGIMIGYIVDYLFPQIHFAYQKSKEKHDHHHSIPFEALTRAFKIYVFIFFTNTLLSLLIETIGENQLAYLLFQKSLLQPIVSAFFGFIPNCASSVILTQLYIKNILSFSSLIAGLMTNAGIGLLILIKHRLDIKTLSIICSILFISALVVSLIVQGFSF